MDGLFEVIGGSVDEVLRWSVSFKLEEVGLEVAWDCLGCLCNSLDVVLQWLDYVQPHPDNLQTYRSPQESRLHPHYLQLPLINPPITTSHMCITNYHHETTKNCRGRHEAERYEGRGLCGYT